MMAVYKARLAHTTKPTVAAAGYEKTLSYAMKNKGDIKIGKALFNRQGCISCHAVSNAGIQKGFRYQKQPRIKKNAEDCCFNQCI